MRYLHSALSVILSNSSLLDIEIALEEVISNVIEHSYTPEQHGDIEFTFTLRLDRIVIQVDDFGEKGRQYNFTQAGHFASVEELRSTGAEKRGGMGVYLVRKIMDEVTYTVSPGEYNRITMVKIFRNT
jgi:serine/threonine-protein kinase RsbW